ncbi:MAG: DUF6456 domain-containing protein [Bdellovibrionales bacterium]
MAVAHRRPPVASDRRLRPNREGVSDYGPRERWQHSGRALERTEREGILAARATEEHVLDVLGLLGILSSRQRGAALALKQDFQQASLSEHVTSGYNPVRVDQSPTPGTRDRTDAEEAAYSRWRAAAKSLGARHSGVVLATVCYDQSPCPAQIALLREGLERLARWYRMA